MTTTHWVRNTFLWFASLVAVAVAVAVWQGSWRPGARRPRVRLSITLPTTAPLSLSPAKSIDISPDGTRVAYAASIGDTTQIYVRRIDGFEATPLGGTDGAVNPFFSPDGRWVGFFADGRLKKVSVEGGPPLTICAAPADRGAAWGPDNTIVFPAAYNSGLWRVRSTGGTPQPLTRINQQRERSHRWPHFLPGGKAIVFTQQKPASSGTDDGSIVVLSLETGEQTVVVESGSSPQYAASGHIVFARGGSLLAVPFDERRLQTTGPPVAVLEGVSTQSGTGAAQFSMATNGTLVYVPGSAAALKRHLAWVDRAGVARLLDAGGQSYSSVRLSPDGHYIVMSMTDPSSGVSDVWVHGLAAGTLTRITSGPGASLDPIWSSDGRQIFFAAARHNAFEIYRKASDGSGSEQLVLASAGENNIWPREIASDGRWLLFDEHNAGIGLIELTDGAQPRPLVARPFEVGQPRLSPDGAWMAYESNESGGMQVYVQAFPGPDGKRQVSTDGGTHPVWARTGSELFYRHGDRLMVVPVSTIDGFISEPPQVLFAGVYDASYDVTPDDQHFLMIKGERQAGPLQLNVVLDWFSEIARGAPH